MNELVGKIKAVVFSNKANGFHVLRVTPDGSANEQRVVGAFPGVNLSTGIKARFKGKREVHPSFGDQFTASSCEIQPDKGKSGVMTYLVNQVPSIGIVTASRLYDCFGEDLLRILDSDAGRLSECAFLNDSQREALAKEWSAASAQRNTSIYLSDLGLTTGQIKTILTNWGVGAREKISANPYSLMSLQGIGFSTADSIALKLDSAHTDSPKRVQGMVLHAMHELSTGEGHMYSTSSQIIDFVNNRLFRKGGIQAFSHGDFMTESQFYSALTSFDQNQVVSKENDHYLALHYLSEFNIANFLSSIMVNPIRLDWDVDGFLARYEVNNNIQLAPDQKRVFSLIKENRVVTVTGYPGTGKTTLIKALVELFESHNKSVTLMSPTGIAAKRLAQVTGRPASTIHRALGYNPESGYEFNELHKYAADIVIVDEMSMVDSETFCSLVAALHPSCSLVMVGDTAQLPSVGCGHVLEHLTRTSKIPHVSLTRIYRQGKTSDIITAAHAILNNTALDLNFNRDSEFVVLGMPTSQVMEEICKLSSRLKAANKNFQVIAPKYDGDLGVNALNNALRQVLNPASDFHAPACIKVGDSGIYEGDRVMVIKNDYQRGVFNGDVGKVLKINLREDAVDVKVFGVLDTEATYVRYVDKTFTYKVEEARQMLKVAYACTAHKVQGQEFDYVIMPMHSQYGIMLYKNLVYTAITRAKQKVFIFGDTNAFTRAITNTREVVRNSRLSSMVLEQYENRLLSSVQES